MLLLLVFQFSLNPVDGRPIAVNSTFESIMGPFYKFKEREFTDAAYEDINPRAITHSTKETNRSKFRDAINKVRIFLATSSPTVKMELNGCGKTGMSVKIRNVDMITLGTNEAGLPVRKYFDWSIGTMQYDHSIIDAGETSVSSVVMLYGEMVNELESSDR